MSDPFVEKVTISKREYDNLISDQFKLQCLEGAGVDNWEGYEEAMDLYQNAGEEIE